MKRLCTDESVLEWMKEHADQRYECNVLAKRFGVKSETMSIILRRLLENDLIEKVSDGRRGYYVYPYFSRKGAVPELQKIVFKPLKGYEAMMRRHAENAVKGRR